MATPIKLGLVGAFGRMGQRVIRLVAEKPRFQLTAVLSRSPARPVPAGAQLFTDAMTFLTHVDAVIDFSAPPVCGALAPACGAQGTPYVLASTGLSKTDEAAVHAAAQRIPVLQAANLSTGVNVMLRLVQEAAAKLAGYDIEISEIHHRHKRDAPSGTALALGAAAQAGRGPLQAVLGRHGLTEPRADDELGYGALRGGEVAGEHTVYFFGTSERLEITHRSTSADIFADGALRACAWLVGQAPGQYTMQDVLASAAP